MPKDTGTAGKYVTRYSARGTPFAVWEPVMPRIDDEYLTGSIYLYRSRHEAQEGINTGGSGFFVQVPCETTLLPLPWCFMYVVTNRHVVEEGATVLRINTTNGGFDIFEYTKNDFTLSDEDDLAIMAVPELPISKYDVRGMPRNRLASKEYIAKHNFGVGDEVVLIGRFINQEGKEQNIPTARFGHISQMPKEPIEYEGRLQDSFICEVKSVGGFSGSPVFLAPWGKIGRPIPNHPEVNESRLLGIDWAHIQNLENACDEHGREIPHILYPSNTGMMAVVPAWKLDKMFDIPSVRQLRLDSEQWILAKQRAPKVKPDSAKGSPIVGASFDAPPASGESTTHREDFMRLVDAAARKPAQED